MKRVPAGADRLLHGYSARESELFITPGRRYWTMGIWLLIRRAILYIIIGYIVRYFGPLVLHVPYIHLRTYAERTRMFCIAAPQKGCGGRT